MTAVPVVKLDEFNAKADAYLRIHRRRPTRPFIANVQTEVDAIEAGGALFPVTVNDAEPDNAWVCSPLTTYASYAMEEVERLGHPLITAPLKGLARGVGSWLRHASIDRAVAINNWLVSTNAYPDLGGVGLDQVLAEAMRRYPTHAIWLRSLNSAHHADWLRALSDRGCIMVPSRQVYLFEDVAKLALHRTDLKRDLALLRQTDRNNRIARDFDDADFRRIAELYADLYMHKYSALNPFYDWTLIKAWSQGGLLELSGIRDEAGVLQGAVGIIRFGNLLTSPIVGYNTSLPAKLGLYRMLSALVMRQAATDTCLVNLSAGVAHFKRQRGGQPAIEYSAVFASHLPQRTQVALKILGAATRHIGVPIMRRYKL
ncbi:MULTISPECIES: hypothetical protein [unclassified Rhodanobacter]|uniref:hypothetical protein n=1 Tax=unclassified Rhodanobacter TaxID=2621553 RepID=UPI001611CD5D|nr:MULTISPECIES: hypothetical protein [unclassified Rhodanobacter]MBB6241813.1 hypothetical protein [Rhodanobacter sp. MP1X3]MBB6246071.1 hypothetical protein [Rhodanobacter sp. A1T4]